MKVSYIGKADPITFTNGKEYTVLSIERGWYRILVDFGEDYLFPSDVFKVVEGGPGDLPEDKPENWWRGSRGGVNGVENMDEERRD